MVSHRFKYLFISIGLLLLAACSSFDRTAQSGYSGNSQSGWKKTSTNMTTMPQTSRPELRNLEASLSGKRDIEQYSKALPWFTNDDERTEFLALKSFEDRQRWMLRHEFFNRPKEALAQYQQIIETRDIAVGMPEPLVKKSWGDPEFVDASGNPMFKNYRYRYQKQIPTVDGYREERKTVFIEAGRVSGWETE